MMKTSERAISQVEAPRISIHAGQRLRQRGLQESDLERIRSSGEEFSEGYLMSDRAIRERVSMLKREIQRLERLKGAVLIEQGNTLVTVYRADRKRCCRILSTRGPNQFTHMGAG
jgi:hypothetical protein